VKPQSATEPQKTGSFPEAKGVSFILFVKEAVRSGDVRIKIGVLLVLLVLGVVIAIHFLTEKRSPSSLPSIEAPSTSLSSSPSSQAPSIIKADLSKEEPSKEGPPEKELSKKRPSREELAKEETSRRKPSSESVSKEEPSKRAETSKERPSPPQGRSDQPKPRRKPISPEKEEKREAQPAQKTLKQASIKSPDAKTSTSLSELVSQGPGLLQENQCDTVLEWISKLSGVEKESINIKILECFAHLKKSVEERKPFLKKILPPLRKSVWKDLYNSLSHSEDRSGTPLLLRIAKDPEETTRYYAVSLLGNIGDERALRDLQEIASSGSSEKIREVAKKSISSIQSRGSSPSSPSGTSRTSRKPD